MGNQDGPEDLVQEFNKSAKQIKNCNNTFVGNQNLLQFKGSTFSYYILKLVGKNVKKILIDLDKIHDEPKLHFK